MNRAQSYAYGYGSSEAGGVFREKAPAGSSSHDVHRYREPEPEGPSPTWSGSEHDADMEATAPSRRGRSRVSRGGILERSEIVLNSPDSEDRTEYYDQRRYAQPSSQSYPPRFSYAEEENHRLHSQRQELLQRTDENRSCTFDPTLVDQNFSSDSRSLKIRSIQVTAQKANRGGVLYLVS